MTTDIPGGAEEVGKILSSFLTLFARKWFVRLDKEATFNVAMFYLSKSCGHMSYRLDVRLKMNKNWNMTTWQTNVSWLAE